MFSHVLCHKWYQNTVFQPSKSNSLYEYSQSYRRRRLWHFLTFLVFVKNNGQCSLSQISLVRTSEILISRSAKIVTRLFSFCFLMFFCSAFCNHVYNTELRQTIENFRFFYQSTGKPPGSTTGTIRTIKVTLRVWEAKKVSYPDWQTSA